MEFSSGINGTTTDSDAPVPTHIFNCIMTPQGTVHRDTFKPVKQSMEQFHQEL